MAVQTALPPRYVKIPEIDTELISRIDVSNTPRGAQVFKWRAGWTASTPPCENYVIPDKTAAELLALLKQPPWVIHTWGYGGRAWLYKAVPVRTSEQTRSLRHRLANFPDPRIENFHSLDLIFDL